MRRLTESAVKLERMYTSLLGRIEAGHIKPDLARKELAIMCEYRRLAEQHLPAGVRKQTDPGVAELYPSLGPLHRRVVRALPPLPPPPPR